MEARVILLNPDLTHAVPPQLLQGFSGRTYGLSRWNAAHHCHTVEMSVGDFDKCWQDLQRAVHLPMRRWFPVFVAPEIPPAVREFAMGYELGLAGKSLAGDAAAAAKVGWEIGAREAAPPGATKETAVPAKLYSEAQPRQKSRKTGALKKDVLELGISVNAGESGEALMVATLDAQKRKEDH